MKENNVSICTKLAETDEELCGEGPGMSITFKKMKNLSEYLEKADVGNDIRLLEERFDEEDELSGIYINRTLVGFGYVDDDEKAELFVYIHPDYRRNGYGELAVKSLEAELRGPAVKAIMTAFDYNDDSARKFAEKLGYRPTWSSTFMIYRGKKFDIPELPVRQYRDEDYEEAFYCAAEAFHMMRLGTGCFPDSEVGSPTEERRKKWNEHRDDEYVYVIDDEIVGVANVDDDELDTISIKISRQGNGYGKLFVKYMTNLLIDRGHNEPVLWCVVGNKKARNLYDSLGYKVVFTEAFAEKKMN